MQVHRRTRLAGPTILGYPVAPAGLATFLVIALIAILMAPGIALGQESPSPQPGMAVEQVTIAPEPTAPPMDPSTDPATDPTVPLESPTPAGTETAVPPPDPSATMSPPAQTPTVPPVTGMPTNPPATLPPIAPTGPPAILTPTNVPASLPPNVPADDLPDNGEGIAPVNAPIRLIDRFDDPALRLLGETRASDERITGRYEDGRYRLEIDGPEVAPDLIAVVRSPNLVDATIQVTARLEGTTRDRYVMATCREVEGYGGYRAYLSPDDGYFAITRFEPGAYPMELQRGFAEELLQGNDPFEFAFSCVGFVLELRVNGETIGIAADNAFASGIVSIGTGYFSNAEPGPVTAMFQDLDVTGSATATGPTAAERLAEAPRGPIPADGPPVAARREFPAA